MSEGIGGTDTDYRSEIVSALNEAQTNLEEFALAIIDGTDGDSELTTSLPQDFLDTYGSLLDDETLDAGDQVAVNLYVQDKQNVSKTVAVAGKAPTENRDNVAQIAQR
jgi:hypothetical protein